MTQLSIPSGEYLAVVVPVDAGERFDLLQAPYGPVLLYCTETWIVIKKVRILGYPFESLELLGRFRDLTEEECRGIFAGAAMKQSDELRYTTKPIESLASLLRSHDLEPDEIVLLKIKK